MAVSADFIEKLKIAIKTRSDWLNAEMLPKMLDQYRLLHTCVHNIYDTLLKRSLIIPDPYKLETKITDIILPDDSHFSDNDRAMIMGSRFSIYESMLDYVCTYVKFSTDFITIPYIKKLLDLNNVFQWNAMSTNSSRTNTRGLALLIQEAKQSSQQITASLLNDSIQKSADAIKEINDILKELMVFQKEAYKIRIRLDVTEHPKFDKQKAYRSQSDEISEIKKNIPSIMGKFPYYTELIQEIVSEDLSQNANQIREQTLAKLAVKTKAEKTKKVSVDYKVYLLDCLHTIASLGELYTSIAEKLQFNVNVLENQKNSFFTRLRKAFRNAFKLKDPPLIYDFIIVDPKKDTKSHRNVDISIFISAIAKKASFYTPLANTKSPEFIKIKGYPEQNILDYLNKTIAENQEILTLLSAADEYFKKNVSTFERYKIKGLKMDLISVKNIIVKAVQKRSEYATCIEEQEQMKKLGIDNGF